LAKIAIKSTIDITAEQDTIILTFVNIIDTAMGMIGSHLLSAGKHIDLRVISVSKLSAPTVHAGRNEMKASKGAKERMQDRVMRGRGRVCWRKRWMSAVQSSRLIEWGSLERPIVFGSRQCLSQLRQNVNERDLR
jgi:hypothetical protein